MCVQPGWVWSAGRALPQGPSGSQQHAGSCGDPQSGDRAARQFAAVLGLSLSSHVARSPVKALWKGCTCVREYGTEGKGQAGGSEG